jgi:hypothetical protein
MADEKSEEHRDDDGISTRDLGYGDGTAATREGDGDLGTGVNSEPTDEGPLRSCAHGTRSDGKGPLEERADQEEEGARQAQGPR